MENPLLHPHRSGCGSFLHPQAEGHQRHHRSFSGFGVQSLRLRPHLRAGFQDGNEIVSGPKCQSSFSENALHFESWASWSPLTQAHTRVWPPTWLGQMNASRSWLSKVSVQGQTAASPAPPPRGLVPALGDFCILSLYVVLVPFSSGSESTAYLDSFFLSIFPLLWGL